MQNCKLVQYLLMSMVASISCSAGVPAAGAGDESILSTASLFQAEPRSPEWAQEAPILHKWRETAKSTETGERLLSWLDDADGCLQFNSTDVDALYRRAYIYGLIGCTKLALADLSKAIQQDPSQAQLFRERGICYVDQQSYEKALGDFNQAIALNPLSGDTRLARARLLMQMGRPHQALDDLLVCKRDQLEFKPLLPGELAGNFYKAPDYYLGACYEALGRKQEALRHFRESARLDSVAATGAYVHRYADQPTDVAVCIKRLQGF